MRLTWAALVLTTTTWALNPLRSRSPVSCGRRQTRLLAAESGGDAAQELLDEAAALRAAAAELEEELAAERPEVVEDVPAPVKQRVVCVAGANGRLGSLICRAMLDTQPEDTRLVALVHDTRTESTARLSYESGAEDMELEFAPPFWVNQEEQEPRAPTTPLGRMELRVCDLLDPEAVKTALRGVDTCLFAATSFAGKTSRRPTAGVEGKVSALGKDIAGMFFEFKAPSFTKLSQTKSYETNVDMEGVVNVAEALLSESETPQFVLVSAASAEEKQLEAKRQGEAALLRLIPAAVVVRPTVLNDAGVRRQGGKLNVLKDGDEGGDMQRGELARFLVGTLNDPTKQGQILTVAGTPKPKK